LNNAEQLKSLAAQVNEVVQPDGSIVKEYVLNDPQIIEQIRNRIKAESASAIIKPPAQFVDSNTTTTTTTNENENSLKQFFKPFIEPVLNSSRKETKTPKQEEFINAWSSPNETNNNNNNNTKSLPFLTQIQNQIEKFQNKNKSNEQSSTSVTTPPPPPPVSIGQQQQQQLENKIASQLSNKYLSEIENDSYNSSIKQIKQNKFQLKTKKGKSLHFTITSDDPTESDIEEVKFIINKSIENLANENDQLNQENLFKKQITTSSAQNFSSFNNNEDKYFKSSSFQPNNHTSPTNDQLVHKSGSAGCFKQPQQPPPLLQQQQQNESASKTTPGGFLNANNSHIKHYPNMNPVNSSNKIYKIEPIHTSTSNNTPKSIYSKNLYNPTSSNSDSDENINQIISKATTITNPNTTNDNNKKNYLQRSNSFGTGQESTSSDTEFNYFRNKSKTNTTTTTTNFNNNNNNNNSSKKQNIFNGGTYTKSTINFSHPSYDSDEYNYNNHTNSSKKYKLKTKLSKTPNQMNRSVNNIYNDSK
jgi:hypothetical protein